MKIRIAKVWFPFIFKLLLEKAFHELHKQRYGHAMNVAVELVTLRVAVTVPTEPLRLEEVTNKVKSTEPKNYAKMVGCDQPVPVFQRDQLAPQQSVKGPALIVETVSTTYVDTSWCCILDYWGNLILTR